MSVPGLMGNQIGHLQQGVKVAGQAVAQRLGQAIAGEDKADAAGVVRAQRLVGVVKAEDRLGRAQGREAVHLHNVGRLVVLQIIVCLH